MAKVSISPEGVKYALPDEKAGKEEIKILDEITAEQTQLGRKVVAIQGLGFVGAVMAEVVADSTDSQGKPIYFVHGVQRPSTRSYWKVPVINKGESPIEATDPEVAEIFPRIVKEKKTLRATWSSYAFSLADIIVVDIQLDATKPVFGDAAKGYCDTGAFEKAIADLGRNIKPDALVLVETTVPPGTCQHIVKPILEKEFKARGIDISKNPPRIAHSYERVMPGRNYVSSIRNFWRTYSGIDEESAKIAQEFLTNVLDTKEYPLYRLNNTNASELSKTFENSFRATNIALVYEWTLFAEEVGINLFEVVKSIRVRPTHKNLMNPGFGVGGYCLTKDPVLAHWASLNVFKRKKGLEMAVEAVNINDLMPLHSLRLTKSALGGTVSGKHIHLLGASYLSDVGDTRHSPSEIFWKAAVKEGASLSVHDPLVKVWPEIPEAKVEKDLLGSLKNKDALIFAVGHKEYLGLDPEKVVEAAGKPLAVIDTQNLLTDGEIKKYLNLGCKVKGVGKGHIETLRRER
ncbi:MAG: nucleotide sugar dehydrogenase [Candidatus Omnitrophica bacterium]|nr:nucleotide sugar dehydrogenase [Candidatus Omnitrophota bacterium]